MINNKQPGSLNARVLLLWLTVAVIAPYQSEGVYYTLIGGNHVMHFKKSYWKKLVLGAIIAFCEVWVILEYTLSIWLSYQNHFWVSVIRTYTWHKLISLKKKFSVKIVIYSERQSQSTRYGAVNIKQIQTQKKLNLINTQLNLIFISISYYSLNQLAISSLDCSQSLSYSFSVSYSY